MFSRRNRHPVPLSAGPAAAVELLDAGDVPGALRQLRQDTAAPLHEVAGVLALAAGAAGFDDLRKAAEALAAHPDRVRPLYDYGYVCVERGVPDLAIPALREAFRLAPESAGVLRELVSAYER
jgi:cytochrome c-type biogenesis protein CcmH/NrfG